MSGAPPGWTTPAGRRPEPGHRLPVRRRGPHDAGAGAVATPSTSAASPPRIRRATWTVYQDGTFQRWTGQGYATGTAPNYTYTLINPVSITIIDTAGQTLQPIQATRASTSGALQPTDSFPQSSYVRWATTQYVNTYFVASQRVYKLIPASGTGTSGTNYDETRLRLRRDEAAESRRSRRAARSRAPSSTSAATRRRSGSARTTPGPRTATRPAAVRPATTWCR